MSDIVREFKMPEKLAFFADESWRYKGAYGGRGSGKSWGIARALLARAAMQSTRALCGREIQDSIRESVHELLSGQIKRMGLSGYFNVRESYIEGRRNDSYVFFSGLKHKIDGIKSAEDIDVCWVEEADTVSDGTWRKLTPTIRKPGSEIWLSWNPSHLYAPTYQRYVVKPPENSKIVRVNWQDNPFFTDELEAERQDSLSRETDEVYQNIWEGVPLEAKEGAVYAKEIREARADGRITSVPVERSKPVTTIWDIGKRDATAIWFCQWVGFELRIIDYYEAHHDSPADYVQMLQGKGYVYDLDWLPHDATAERLGMIGTVRSQLAALGRNVQITPNLPVNDGIALARTIFPRCYFDEVRCADGLHALRNYAYKFNQDDKVFGVVPHHDWASNGADAFRYLGIVMQDRGHLAKPATPKRRPAFSTDWMS